MGLEWAVWFSKLFEKVLLLDDSEDLSVCPAMCGYCSLRATQFLTKLYQLEYNKLSKARGTKKEITPLTWSLLVQFSSVTQSCPTLCTPGLPVHHQLPEFTQTHVHRVRDTIQPSHPLSSPSPPAPNPSQHQSLFQWVNSLHEVAKVLEFQL